MIPYPKEAVELLDGHFRVPPVVPQNRPLSGGEVLVSVRASCCCCCCMGGGAGISEFGVRW